MNESKKARYLERAKELYESDDLQIADDAKLSEGVEGVWVAAWVLVDSEEAPAVL